MEKLHDSTLILAPIIVSFKTSTIPNPHPLLPMIQKCIVTAFAVFAYLISTPVASAELLVSYSFDIPPYAPSSDLAGQQGWAAGSGYSAGNTTVNATGLTHAGLLGASGGSLVGLNTTFGGQSNTGQVISPTTGSNSALGSSVQYWFCALISLTGNGGSSADGNFVNMDFKSGDTNGGFVFGLLASDGESGLEYDFMFGAQATNTGAGGYISNDGFTGTQYVGGTTALVVGRMTVNNANASSSTTEGKETFDFWLNPTDATSEATLTSTAQGTLHSQTISVLFGDWGDVTVSTQLIGSVLSDSYQDEIRVATSLSDLNLATVPEPTTTALMFGFATLLGAYYWRRR